MFEETKSYLERKKAGMALLCMNIAKLRDTNEKVDATRGLCLVLQQIPDVFPDCFPQFVALVASC